MLKYNYIEIGNRIRSERNKLKLSQENLIHAIKSKGKPTCGRNILSGLENGDESAFNGISLDKMLALCEEFNCSLSYLLGEYSCKNYDTEFIHQTIGLSEDAVTYLIDIQEKKQLKETELETIDPSSNLLEKKQQETDRNAITEKQIIQCTLDDLIKEKTVLEPVLSHIWEYCHFRHSYDTYEKIDKDKPLSDIERVFLKDPKDRPFSKEDNKNLKDLNNAYRLALFEATQSLTECIKDIYKTKYLDK